jgi:ATP-dependent 26S proteasome regulatory subunit
MDFSFEDIMRSQLLLLVHNLRFNNIYSIVSVIFLFLIISNIQGIRTYIEDIIKPYLSSIFAFRRTTSIELVGCIIENMFGSRKQYSKRFLSLVHYIHNKLEKQQEHHYNVTKMIEICVRNEDHVLNDGEDDLLINQIETIQLDKDIYCKFLVKKEQDFSEKSKQKFTNVSATLFSRTKTISELKSFIEQCVCDYDYFIQQKLQKSLYYFVYDIEEDVQSFKKVVFQSTKSFDNVFFTEKNALIERLTFFQNCKEQYSKFGIPYTFGILMHGDPGTGKTSTIKAIANFTNRHIISIPLYKVKNISTLTKLFLNVEIDGVNVPFDKRIYVFEEIDCNGLKEVVKHRVPSLTKALDEQDVVNTLKEHLHDLPDISSEQIKHLINKASLSSNVKGEPKTEITLGGLLELIDGLVETPGRIIIMTTNYPESLDHALIRPGRIDMNIRYEKASKEDIFSMFKLWFDIELSIEELSEVREQHFSHAEVCQMFFNSNKMPSNVLALLKSDIVSI